MYLKLKKWLQTVRTWKNEKSFSCLLFSLYRFNNCGLASTTQRQCMPIDKKSHYTILKRKQLFLISRQRVLGESSNFPFDAWVHLWTNISAELIGYFVIPTTVQVQTRTRKVGSLEIQNLSLKVHASSEKKDW